jgi:hypothetical protein
MSHQLHVVRAVPQETGMIHCPATAVPTEHRPIEALETSTTPIVLRALEAARLFRVSERTWRSWDACAMVPQPIQLGRAKWWRPQELIDWAAAGCPRRKIWFWKPGK